MATKTATKIQKLTPEQETRLKTFRSEWLRVGLSTEPADHARAEAAITAMYGLLGKKRPTYLWFSSPYMAILAIGLLRLTQKTEIRDQIRDQLRGQLGDQLWDQLQLRGQLWGQLGGQLGGQLRDQLRDQLWDQLWGQLWDLTWRNIWGQQEAYWIAFYLFGLEIGATYHGEDARRLNLWVEVAKSTHWWWPFEGVCVLSERPETLSLEPTRRNANLLQLHNDNGPAMDYRDGWGVYAVHGVRVPSDVFEHPERLTAERVLGERNAEVRRVMIERMGRERFFAEAAPEVLDSDTDDQGYPMRLLRVDLDQDEPYVALECVCPSTGRIYLNRVGPQNRTAMQAKASRWRKTVSQWKPLWEA